MLFLCSEEHRAIDRKWSSDIQHNTFDGEKRPPIVLTNSLQSESFVSINSEDISLPLQTNISDENDYIPILHRTKILLPATNPFNTASSMIVSSAPSVISRSQFSLAATPRLECSETFNYGHGSSIEYDADASFSIQMKALTKSLESFSISNTAKIPTARNQAPNGDKSNNSCNITTWNAECTREHSITSPETILPSQRTPSPEIGPVISNLKLHFNRSFDMTVGKSVTVHSDSLTHNNERGYQIFTKDLRLDPFDAISIKDQYSVTQFDRLKRFDKMEPDSNAELKDCEITPLNKPTTMILESPTIDPIRPTDCKSLGRDVFRNSNWTLIANGLDNMTACPTQHGTRPVSQTVSQHVIRFPFYILLLASILLSI